MGATQANGPHEKNAPQQRTARPSAAPPAIVRLSRVNSNGEHAPNTKYYWLLWVAMIARWRLCDKTQYEHAVKGKRVVEWGPI